MDFWYKSNMKHYTIESRVDIAEMRDIPLLDILNMIAQNYPQGISSIEFTRHLKRHFGVRTYPYIDRREPARFYQILINLKMLRYDSQDKLRFKVASNLKNKVRDK